MEVVWCWRCQLDIPMLDEDEWQKIVPFLGNMIPRIKTIRQDQGVSLGEAQQLAHRDAVEKYFELAGFQHDNGLAIYHHRRSIYGCPCANCGRVLRTPIAAKCFECGTPATNKASS